MKTHTIRIGYKKNSRLMKYRKIIAVCFVINTKRISTLCGQNVKFLNVKPDDS